MSVPSYKKWFLKAEPYQNSMHIDTYLRYPVQVVYYEKQCVYLIKIRPIYENIDTFKQYEAVRFSENCIGKLDSFSVMQNHPFSGFSVPPLIFIFMHWIFIRREGFQADVCFSVCSNKVRRIFGSKMVIF